MVGLSILKHLENLSDEVVVERWVQNPYYQAFTGEVDFQWSLPCERSDMTYFRKRLGSTGFEKILALSIAVHGEQANEDEMCIDTTVQDKNITFPTDAKQYRKGHVQLLKIARQEGLELTRSYEKEVQELKRHTRFATHPKNRKKARHAVRLHGYAAESSRFIIRNNIPIIKLSVMIFQRQSSPWSGAYMRNSESQTQKRDRAKLGVRLRRIRKRNGWTLAQVGKMTGLAASTLSKVENDQISLAYDNLIRLADGLGIDIVNLFSNADQKAAPGRRSITRHDRGKLVETPNYSYEYLCTDLAKKRMIPISVRVKARSIMEFGELLRHAGEEFIYVLQGEIEVHTEFYEPLSLMAGDCVYIDSTMAHGYIMSSAEDAHILGVCSGPETLLDGTLELPGPEFDSP